MTVAQGAEPGLRAQVPPVGGVAAPALALFAARAAPAAAVADLSRAAEVRRATPMARVTTNEASTILRFLDSGVHGVHVPWVNSAEEAERAVQAVKYGPRGRRGLAGNRGGDWAANAESTAAANEETLVVVQVETAEAVDRIGWTPLFYAAHQGHQGPVDLFIRAGMDVWRPDRGGSTAFDYAELKHHPHGKRPAPARRRSH